MNDSGNNLLLKEDREIVIGENLDFFLRDFLVKENPRFELSFNNQNNTTCKIIFIKVNYNDGATIALVSKKTFNINLN